MRRISSFMLWVLLGAAVAIIPIACGSSSSTNDGSTDSSPDSMTQV